MKQHTVPVLLLTGYLGSGKTTLLNRILTNRQGIRFAVVVNDIGAINIDAELIQKGGVVRMADDNLVALQNGCICCTLRTDLIEQLHDIIAQRRFDYIVIEASGICEPAPIAQTICSFPTLDAKYTEAGIPVTDCIVTVVDALRMRDEFDSGNRLLREQMQEDDIENLLIQQIEFCNIVLLNKASDVSASDLDRLTHIVRSLQPQARILSCDYGDVDLNSLLHTGLFDFDRVATSATWIEELEKPYPEADRPESENGQEEHEAHHHDHHDHEEGESEEYGIETYVYFNRRPMDLSRFDDFVARKWPSNVIRAKGMCYFAGEEDTCYVFEQAGRQLSLRDAGLWYAAMPHDELLDMMQRHPELLRDWDTQYGDRMQKIVFIGQHLDKHAITELLDQCLTA